MSSSLEAGESVAAAGIASDTEGLRKLYYARFAFAIVWAALLAITASTLTPVSVALVVIYPLFDVAAAVFDSRSSGASGASGARGPLYLNMVLSLLSAIALAVGVASGIPSVLRVWGAWAVTAGIVQLIVAIQRYRLGGQRAMILSGAISAVAGAGFILSADGPKVSLSTLAGYATLGGVLFLVSAIRMHRRQLTANR
jgi:uncharacterized membrane protein HdeD (DUF308 family)